MIQSTDSFIISLSLFIETWFILYLYLEIDFSHDNNSNNLNNVILIMYNLLIIYFEFIIMFEPFLDIHYSSAPFYPCWMRLDYMMNWRKNMFLFLSRLFFVEPHFPLYIQLTVSSFLLNTGMATEVINSKLSACVLKSWKTRKRKREGLCVKWMKPWMRP